MTTHAAAQAEVTDVEVPAVVLDFDDPSIDKSDDDALDLANIVQSAAKGLTTVQEAPAIVTVVTADEIRERQIQDIAMLTDTVPGWMRLNLTNSFFPMTLVRGQVFAVQFLHDGVSLFDPLSNTPSLGRQQPMELIKRVEMITGPGGVLWGANSLLGIMNVITKDAEDIEGVEVGSTIGHGKGDRQMARAYVMAGKSDVMGGKLKVFAHGSVETYQGAALDMPLLLFHEPIPQPNSDNSYGPLTETNQKQSVIVSLNGKVTIGKLQLRASVPFGKMYRPMGVSGNPAMKDMVEDAQCMNNGVVDPACLDNLRASRSPQWVGYDRYLVAEYRDRFASGKAGIAVRGYANQFERGLNPLVVLAPSPLIQGGLSVLADMDSYRVGGALDGDIEVAKPLRVLYGAEAFYEWMPDSSGDSRQGAGTGTSFLAPYNLERLPLPCPRVYDPGQQRIVPVAGCPLTFAFQSDRTVVGAYANPQLRPSKKLILDAGARAQVAPDQLGSIGYPLTLTTSGALVWNVIPNWHLKLNYTQGFRPPVFMNVADNDESVTVGGDPDLKVETSDAMQAEINARIFKGERRIRELSFRLDGSYTRLQNLIQVAGGRYENAADRAIASGEFLGKLFIQGGHRLELAYTYMRVATADRGLVKAMPEHFFNFTTVFNLVSNKLTGTTNLKVMGSAEDPNRLVEYRDTMYDADGHPVNPTTSRPSDAVLDKIPAIAELSLGVNWTPTPSMLIRATVYNALMQHSYQADAFFDYEPHVEYLPNPYEGLRAYLSATYQY
jgi:outer membrane receptor protein involved in Fe transport